MIEWLSSGCLLGSALSAAALLSDPDGAPVHLAERERAELARQEVLGRVAIALDAGFSPLRWLVGMRRARDLATEILADAAADISRAHASVARYLPALRAEQRPAPPPPADFREAVAIWVVSAIRGPDRTIPAVAVEAGRQLDAIPRAVARARIRLALLLLGFGGLRWLECLGLGLAIRAAVWRARPALGPPAPRSLGRHAETREISLCWFRRRPSSDPLERELTAAGVPVSLAGEIAGYFAAQPEWPGSLRGHDRAPQGLRHHTLSVVHRMAALAAQWPAQERQMALVVAAAHDLGKLIAYRRVAAARWVGSATTPHDSLSVMLLMQCPSWKAFGRAETRAAGLQALFFDHAPEGLPANAPALARALLTALAQADAEAAQESTRPTTPPTDGRTHGA
jgi:hypothetical protein